MQVESNEYMSLCVRVLGALVLSQTEKVVQRWAATASAARGPCRKSYATRNLELVAHLHENLILGVLLEVARDELKLLLGRHGLWC